MIPITLDMTLKGRKWFRQERMLTNCEHAEFLPTDYYKAPFAKVNIPGNYSATRPHQSGRFWRLTSVDGR